MAQGVVAQRLRIREPPGTSLPYGIGVVSHTASRLGFPMDIPVQTRRSRRRYLIAGAAIMGVAVVTLAVSKLDPAVPAVDVSSIWTDTVRLGDMVREVGGPGTLVSEQARWVVATTAGRVERVLVRPGQTVEANDVLLVLSNPDVQVEGLDAERQLSAAQSELTTLRSTLQTQILDQQATLATTRSQHREAQRQLESYRELSGRNLISAHELAGAEDKATELETRLRIDEERLRILEASLEDRIGAQREQVDRLRSISSFQHERARSMEVRAGASGVVQDLTLEMGQWVMPGQTLARVAEPGRLMAELRVAETQARDVAVGQAARIDTRNGVVGGHVRRIDPAVQNGTVTVEIALDGELPRGARPDLTVDGVIEIERLDQVLHVNRPAGALAEATRGVFRIEGAEATRVPVRFGRASPTVIEVRAGLRPGDVIVLSELPGIGEAERIRLR